jgi:hypothetical protein
MGYVNDFYDKCFKITSLLRVGSVLILKVFFLSRYTAVHGQELSHHTTVVPLRINQYKFHISLLVHDGHWAFVIFHLGR